MAQLDQSHVLVLAAGRGTRMGGPKALMRVRDEAWWRHQDRRLREVGVPATWIVSDVVWQAMEGDASRPTRCVRVDSTAPMFTSVLAGLNSLRGKPPEGVFVLPVDAPPPGRRVWHALRSTGLSCPSFEGIRGHPVFLPWSWIEATLWNAIAAAADPSALRLDHLIRDVLNVVPTDDPRVGCNLNTPEDVARYVAADAGGDP